MKILLVSDQFEGPSSNPWLIDDLAHSFTSFGHEVDVLIHSATKPRSRGAQQNADANVRAFSVGTTRVPASTLGKLLSYAFTGIRLHTTGVRFLRRSKYDLAVYTSIAAFSYGFPSRLRRRGTVDHLVFVMWDFFPIHQLEIGRINAHGLAPGLKRLEKLAIKRADVVAVMSPANKAFFCEYHPGISAPIIVIPPWAAPNDLSVGIVAKRPVFTAVFGGQLVKGRGVDTLLDAARQLQIDGVEIRIIIAGEGPDLEALSRRAQQLDLQNTEFVGMLPRKEYRTMLRSAHVGIAVTVAGVSPPSFPSKIVEYCANALPVIVCVEASSDAGEYVELNEVGFAVDAGDSAGLAHALHRSLLEHSDGTLTDRGARAHALFMNELSSDRAAWQMLASISPTHEGRDEN